MKRKHLYILLGAEFAALFVLVLLANGFPGFFSSLAAFPFEQTGAGLRALSLTGRVGNGAALAIWAGLSMLPLVPVMRHRGDKSRSMESSALCLVSGSLFFTLCGMANPVMVYSVFTGMDSVALPVMKAVMGAVVWSLVVLWAVLRLLRLFRQGEGGSLLEYMRVMLCALCALFTGVIALSCGASLVSGLAGAQRGLDGALAAVRFAAAALPYAMDILITLSAMKLMDALLSENAENAAEQADKLSRLCCVSLGVVSASVAVINILQLVLAQYLSNVAVTVDIPVMSLAFVLAALLVSRLIADNRRLKSDNDLFI